MLHYFRTTLHDRRWRQAAALRRIGQVALGFERLIFKCGVINKLFEIRCTLHKMPKFVTHFAVVVFFIVCVSHTIASALLVTIFLRHPSSAEELTHVGNLLQGVQICAGTAALLHLPLFTSKKSRIIVLSCTLFSMMFLVIEAVTLAYTRTSSQLLIKLYENKHNRQAHESTVEDLVPANEPNSACCIVLNTIHQSALKRMFPRQWIPLKCCSLLEYNGKIDGCSDATEILLDLEGVSCLQNRTRNFKKPAKLFLILFGLFLISFTLFEMFFFVMLALYRKLKWN